MKNQKSKNDADYLPRFPKMNFETDTFNITKEQKSFIRKRAIEERSNKSAIIRAILHDFMMKKK